MNQLIALFPIVVIATTVWVGVDAGKQDMSPAGWVIGCLLFWIIVFPAYLIVRSKQPKRAGQMLEPPPPPPPPPPPATMPPAHPVDYLDRLKKLTELRDAGALTTDEFNAEKTAILKDHAASEHGGVA